LGRWVLEPIKIDDLGSDFLSPSNSYPNPSSKKEGITNPNLEGSSLASQSNPNLERREGISTYFSISPQELELHSFTDHRLCCLLLPPNQVLFVIFFIFISFFLFLYILMCALVMKLQDFQSNHPFRSPSFSLSAF